MSQKTEKGNVVPIYNKGLKKYPETSRCIYLTSISGKIVELVFLGVETNEARD